MKLSAENPGEGQCELAALFPTTIALIHVNWVLDHVFIQLENVEEMRIGGFRHLKLACIDTKAEVANLRIYAN